MNFNLLKVLLIKVLNLIALSLALDFLRTLPLYRFFWYRWVFIIDLAISLEPIHSPIYIIKLWVELIEDNQLRRSRLYVLIVDLS